jgi:transcription-repair coupling factor (superfamily II helicase)
MADREPPLQAQLKDRPKAPRRPRAAAATPAEEILARTGKLVGRAKAIIDHVIPAAQPLVAAALARKSKGRVWVVCAGTRAQEELFNDLAHWLPGALFLPEQEIAAPQGALPDPQIGAERLAALERLLEPGGVVVGTVAALGQPAPARGHLEGLRTVLERNSDTPHEALLSRLADAGFERTGTVAVRGQFAVRGGILDVFSSQHEEPVRIEFFGDTIESIRAFDPDTQLSKGELDRCELLLGDATAGAEPLARWVGPEDTVIAVECDPPEGVSARHRILEGSASESRIGEWAGAFSDPGFAGFEAGDFVIDEAKRRSVAAQIRDWLGAGWLVVIHCVNEGEQERVRGLLQDTGVQVDRIRFETGPLTRSFAQADAGFALVADAEIFGRYRGTAAQRLRHARAARRAARTQIDFGELTEGGAVVHVEHGIALYHGLKPMPQPGGVTEDFLELEFADDARLYVPLDHAYLVARYVGTGRKPPALSALGDARWRKARAGAERAVEDYAAGLLGIQAERAARRGHAFKPDTRWQREFERAFLHTETADQLKAIADAKTDMESDRPMDRLICGDVGFGKTEVAIRAAFKAVMDGRQVAVLVPTTVLAQQHYQTFRERMSDYPVRVEVLSRFRSAREQRETLEGLAQGAVDIVIGTHRLLSSDVAFKTLGLVVVDEEQRFGVKHKERLKTLFRLVDVLTLSATPIPRTLYLSLMGARDLSTLETPPANRLPVETVIGPYDERVIRDAIRRELARQGQVYYLHNRIEDIGRVRDRVLHLCPGARVEIGHGQMDEDELEQVMRRFVEGQSDVLVSTTIIESGLDIPNANTIIIDRADRFGLADLYQLRGRVGRSGHKAYAYLLLPRDLLTRTEARKRIEAIRQYSSLGAGLRIAMRDLEIRGAGNLLGTAQSGHISAIGFDLYCQLLRQAVERLKGKRPARRTDIPVDLDFAVTKETAWVTGAAPDRFPAFLPSAYIGDSGLRIRAYRALALAADLAAVDALADEWRDRFGPLPEPAKNALDLARIRLEAARRRISRVEVRDNKLMLTRNGDFLLPGGRFPRLTPPDPLHSVRQIFDFIRAL